MTKRTFEYNEANRSGISLLVSLVGTSSSGKTYSALRLATGIQRVVGKDIALIDTENGRATHYADDFKFRHVPFEAPFDPDSYLAALQHCADKGAGVVIVDSGSHCWEGLGGVLEMHERDLDRMAGDDWKKRDRANFAAWIRPKQAYTRLVQSMLQMPIHLIWCFRAKRKLEIRKGKDPLDLGFMSIAGTEMMYEFTLQALLYPGSQGVPTWRSDLPGEQSMIKLPKQFEHLAKQSGPLTEETGEQLAVWAAGDKATPPEPSIPFPDFLHSLTAAPDRGALDRAMSFGKDEPWTDEQRSEIRGAIKQRRKELDESSEAPDDEPDDSGADSGDGW